MKKSRVVTVGAAAVTALGCVVFSLATASASPEHSARAGHHGPAAPVAVQVLAPAAMDHAGVNGAGWIVDLKVGFPGRDLARTGFSGFQLTGPAAHNNTAPFPGTFSPGQDDRMPGLVVLTSTTTGDRPGFSGPGTNLANLFNVTGVAHQGRDADGGATTELWDNWIVGSDIAGQDVDTVLTVAEVADLDHNGVFDDAPAVVQDLNGDGKVDKQDLAELGVASGIVTVPFHINSTVS